MAVGLAAERGVPPNGSRVGSPSGGHDSFCGAADSRSDAWNSRAPTRFLPSTRVVTVVTLLSSVRHGRLGCRLPCVFADVTEVTNRRSVLTRSEGKREAPLLVEGVGTSLQERRRKRRTKEVPLEFDPGVVFQPSHAKEEDLELDLESARYSARKGQAGDRGGRD